MPEPYISIAQINYDRFVLSELSNSTLQRYFDQCFQDSIDYYSMYPSWACIQCLRQGKSIHMWGKKPPTCPYCETRNTYEVATFQARSSIVGSAFEEAVAHLLERACGIVLRPSPPKTETHDFELPQKAVFELKGSPSRVTNPDGEITKLDKPGMERSDTKRKAFDNAKTFRKANSQMPFYIISNALPQKWIAYQDQDISGIFNVTKADSLHSLVDQLHKL